MPDNLVTPDTCRINGWNRRSTVDAWPGLVLEQAEFREHSLVANDPHLRVPWQHPDDGPWTPEMGFFYRVRPKRTRGATFVRVEGVWWLRYGGKDA